MATTKYPGQNAPASLKLQKKVETTGNNLNKYPGQNAPASLKPRRPPGAAAGLRRDKYPGQNAPASLKPRTGGCR